MLVCTTYQRERLSMTLASLSVRPQPKKIRSHHLLDAEFRDRMLEGAPGLREVRHHHGIEWHVDVLVGVNDLDAEEARRGLVRIDNSNDGDGTVDRTQQSDLAK